MAPGNGGEQFARIGVARFGENGKCIGWPVGGDEKLNQGMPQMFRMMNGARIAVGIQGISVASSARWFKW